MFLIEQLLHLTTSAYDNKKYIPNKNKQKETNEQGMNKIYIPNNNKQKYTNKQNIPIIDIRNVIVIHFVSCDFRINFPIVGLRDDKFSSLVKKLSEEFPEIENLNCYYVANGGKLDLEKTIKENGLGSGCTVIINFYENERVEIDLKNEDIAIDLKNEDIAIDLKNEDIAIAFFSVDQSIINQGVLAGEIEVFSDVEEKLFMKAPEIRNKLCYFLHNGKQIDKELTIKENNIKNGDIIVLNFI